MGKKKIFETEAERKAYRLGYTSGFQKGMKIVKKAYLGGIDSDGYADGYPVYDTWACSNCGTEYDGEDAPDRWRFCGWCGARFEKVTEEEE